MSRWILLLLMNVFLGHWVWAQPSNDDACDALVLTVGSSTVFSNTGATTQLGEPSPGTGTDGPSSCHSQDGWCSFEANVQNSVWFKFVAPPSGKVFVSANANDASLQLAMWRTNNCSEFNAYVELGANNDSNPEIFPLRAPALFNCAQNLIPGETYYIQIDGFNGEETTEAEVLLIPYTPPSISSIIVNDCINKTATATLNGNGLGNVTYSANGTITDNGDGTITISEIVGESVTVVVFDDVSSLIEDVTPCSFTYMADLDIEPPRFIDCPTADIEVPTSIDNCTTIVDFANPSAVDDVCFIPIPTPVDVRLDIDLDFLPANTSWEVRNSAGLIVAAEAYTGSDFGIPQTHILSLRNGTYTFTIFDTDGDGICCDLGQGNWAINYVDDTGAQSFSSPSNGQYGFSESIEFAVTVTEPMSPVSVEQVAGPSSGSEFPIGNTLITYEATDAAGLITSCNFHIVVIDESFPQITCPDNVTVQFEDELSLEFLGIPEVSDNCNVEEVSYSDFSTQSFEGCGLYEFEIYRTFEVLDPSGNTSTCQQQIIVDGLAAPLVTATNVQVNNPTNCGVADGSIVISGLDGLEFALSTQADNWTSIPEFSGLMPGSYSIRVRYPAVECENSYAELVNLIITAPDPPNIDGYSLEVTDPGCNLEGGEIILSGLAEYEYEISSAAGIWTTNSTFSELAPGTYSIRLRNLDGSCTSDFFELNDIVIIAPEVPMIADLSLELNSPTDCGVADGQLVVGGPGASDYEYSINGSDWSAQLIYDGLIAGSYEVQVAQAGGICALVLDVIDLVGPIPPELADLNLASQSPTDCGVADGQLVVGGPGASDYEYSINGSDWSAQLIYDGLIAGSYEVQVAQAGGTCALVLDVIDLVGPIPPVIADLNLASQSPTDCGVADGQLVVGGPGASDYEYSINGSDWSAQLIYDGLIAGSYEVQVAQAGGICALVLDVIDLVGPIPPELADLNLASQSPTDCGVADGQLVVGGPGASDYEYSINGSDWSAQLIYDGLIAGSYEVQVAQAGGICALVLDVIDLVGPIPPELADLNLASQSPTDCGVADGQLVVGGPGASNYEYSINGSDWSAQLIYDGLIAGSYEVQVAQAGGTCALVLDVIDLVGPIPPAIADLNLASQSPTDCGVADGRLTISGPGASNYEYSINGSDWSAQLIYDGLIAGSYEVQVAQAGGTCPLLLGAVEIEAPSAPSILSVERTPPSRCLDEEIMLGRIQIVANGASGANLTYNFNYPDGPWEDVSERIDLGYGSYTLAVRNTDGSCEVIGETVDFIDIGPFEISLTVEGTTDCEAEDGQVHIFTAGGSNSVQFSIDDGLTWQANPTFSGLDIGDYIILAQGLETGCTDLSNASISTALSLDQFSISIVPTSSCGGQDGGIVILNDGEETYEYSLDGGNSWVFGPIISELAAGSYDLLVRLAGLSCEAVLAESIIIDEPNAPVITEVLLSSPVSCEEDLYSVSILVEGNGNSLEYSLDNGLTWQDSPQFEGVEAGEYQPLVQNGLSFCESFPGDLLVVEVIEDLEINRGSIHPASCPDRMDGAIFLDVSGGVTPYTYLWSTGGTEEQLTDLANGETYSCTIVDGRGCTDFIEIGLPLAPDLAAWGISFSDTSICEGSAFRLDIELPTAVADFYWEDNQGNTYNSTDTLVEGAQQISLNVLTLEGCLLTDSFDLSYDSTGREAYFLLPDEGVINSPVIAVDISNPIPDALEWHFDDAVVDGEALNESQHQFWFPESGIYDIGMSAEFGSCWAYLEKSIQIFASEEELSQELPGQFGALIQSFNLFPNPNLGVFQINLQLSEEFPATCWVFNESGTEMYSATLAPNLFHVIPFNRTAWGAGLYTAIVQVGEEYLYTGFVIN